MALSDSDDDVPLGQRTAAAAAPASKPPANPAPKAAARPEEPAPRPRKAPIVDDSSDDDVPIGQKCAGIADTLCGAVITCMFLSDAASCVSCSITSRSKRRTPHACMHQYK